jgi:hypothetical protein
MKRSLSDRLLRSLARPQVTPREVWDQQLRGFGCRASRRGVVSFFTMRRPAGSSKPVRLTFGNFPAMSLLEARQRARALLTELQDGVDPRVRRAEEARVAAAEKASTFGNVAEVFISRHLKTKRTARTIERLIRRELIPRWGERPIAGIAPTMAPTTKPESGQSQSMVATIAPWCVVDRNGSEVAGGDVGPFRAVARNSLCEGAASEVGEERH